MTYQKVKRIIDISISLVLILILLPIGIILALAIKMDSPGPVIFRQDRLGLNGRIFKICKYRSMFVGAEKGGVYETKNDVRVTRVGKLIRRTSVDELPQLINILKGDMSLIGPRPTLTYHPWTWEEYTPEHRKRFSVRPGVTGWAQINGRKNVPWNERINLDIWYVDNMSFKVDAMIFFRTFSKIAANEDNVSLIDTVNNQTIANGRVLITPDQMAAAKDEIEVN